MKTIIYRTQESLFNELRHDFIRDYKKHFYDDYKGQNKLTRKAVLFAVEYTVALWRKQYD